MNNKNNTCIVFCDISKAFDKVWHKGLIIKLRGYGVDGELLRWIESYLINRRQRVFIKDSISSEREISAGVPQGSVLGPLLFLIYINDIADDLESFSRLFADDTSLSYSSSNTQLIEDKLNSDLVKLQQWSLSWLVDFNPLKTKAVFFTNQPNLNPPAILFNNQQVEIIDSHKHLGVHLSSDCKWGTHINSICSNALKQLGVLRKLKFTLSRSNLDKIYQTYILPLLEYGCELWDGCSSESNDKLEKIQHEAARIVTGLPKYASIESLFFETGWESLKERRERRKLSLFHRIHNKTAPSYLSDCLTPLVSSLSNYNLRNRLDYSVPYTRVDVFSKSYFPSTIRLWNNLDIEIRNTPNISTFKRSLKRPANKPPSYFNAGNRKLNIIHTRLRHRSSTLGADLFRVNLTEDPSCQCGWPFEDCIHFFLECPLYVNQRNSFIDTIEEAGDEKITTILFGNELASNATNRNNFIKITSFIQQSGRFSFE